MDDSKASQIKENKTIIGSYFYSGPALMAKA